MTITIEFIDTDNTLEEIDILETYESLDGSVVTDLVLWSDGSTTFRVRGLDAFDRADPAYLNPTIDGNDDF